MKRLISYGCASMILVLSAAEQALAFSFSVPEPGTTTLLASLAVGGFVARKILKRKQIEL